VICCVSRGESDCFALRRGFDLDGLADDLAEMVHWFDLERPLLVGVSFGSAVALHCAARRPGLFAGLGLQGAGLRLETGLVQRIASIVLSSYPLPADSPFVNQFFALLFGQRPTRSDLDHATRTCWQTDQSVMSHRLRLLRRLDLQSLLPHIRVPAVVVSGGKDLVVSDRNAAALANALPSARRVVIDQAGHLAPVSHTEATAAAFEQFFADHVH
jgi:3-oxoadipate enol-lactonase